MNKIILFLLLIVCSCNNNADYYTDTYDFPKIFNKIKSDNSVTGKIFLDNSNKKWDYIIICRPFILGNKLSEETSLKLDEALNIEKKMNSSDEYMLLLVRNQHIVDSTNFNISNSSIQSNYGYIFINNENNYFYYEFYDNILYLYGHDRISQYKKKNPNASTHEYSW